MAKASFCVNHKMDLTLKREMHVYSQIKKTLNSAGEEVGVGGAPTPLSFPRASSICLKKPICILIIICKTL